MRKMFEIGQEVISIAGLRGVVCFVEGSYVCINTGSGVEMDFDACDLKLWVEPVAEKPKPGNLDAKGLFNLPYKPRRGDRKLAADVINKIGEILPPFIRWAESHIDGYSKLDAFDKVKAISEATGTPMIVWMGTAELGGDYLRQVVAQTLMNQSQEDGGGMVGDILLDGALVAIKRWEDANGKK